MNEVSREQSFTRFVYAFVFNPDDFNSFVDKTNKAETSLRAGETAKIWEPARFPKADFLPFVSNFLNSDENAAPSARIWSLANDYWNSNYGFGSRAEWTLKARQTDDTATVRDVEVNFTFDYVELILFRAGLGFITIEANPLSSVLDIWMTFIHFFRFIERDTVSISAKRKTSKTEFTEFFPSFGGSAVESPRKKHCLNEIIDGLLNMLEIKFEQVFVPDQLIPYVALFVKNSPPANDLSIIYKLRNFFHSEQGTHPSRSDLDERHPTLLEYAARQWQIFTLDGGTFISFDAPETEFFRETLSSHLRHQYFLLFQLTLQQRFALIHFSSLISKNWLMKDDEHRAEMFTKIREYFFDFTATGYFVQVMQREHHHRCYVLWQDKFQVASFYDDVRNAIREMHDYLQTRRTEQIRKLAEDQNILLNEQKTIAKESERRAEERRRGQERQIALFGIGLALMFGLPSLLISFLGINLNYVTIGGEDGLEMRKAVGIVLVPLLFGIIVFATLYYNFWKKH